jgi:mRNA-degrading endonuclease RelE of RelBE toxin-antitoxin system
MGSGKWTTKIERGAQRQIEDLPRPDLVREAAEIINELADDPVPSGAIAMRGYNNMYRVRFGSDAFRIVYRADSKNRRITVRAVGPRATVYRGMKR